MQVIMMEAGRPRDPQWETGGSANAKVVSDGCLPSMLIKTVYDGLALFVGPGVWAMKEVFGISGAGVYCADRLATACSESLIPACGGPAGRSGYSGSEIAAADGTIPFKVVLRCLADPSGLFWRKEDSQN